MRIWSNWTRTALRATVVTGAALALLLAGGHAALADGNGSQTTTVHFHNATDSFPSPNPCTGADGVVTLTYNGVMHFTVNKAGDFWATGTETGDFSFVPTDTNQPSYTGHFTSWFGESDNNQNGVDHSTFSLHGTGSDGSSIQFHETQHFSTNANGDVTVSFDKPVCG
ncbi:MAG TPA: hypothetical protein VIC85_10295 [Ktedonobacterales bacterium]|jgi:hypothetical protein